MTANVPMSDADLFAIVADRFQLTDAVTGETVWSPSGHHPRAHLAELRGRLNAWLNGAPANAPRAVDPRDPLTRLLVECRCRARGDRCPVHGVKHRRRGRPKAERDRAIVAHYAESRSYAATAREFGVSWQRVQQIVTTAAPAAPEVPRGE